MPNNPDQIVAFIKDKADHPMKLKELAKALDIDQSEYAHFRKVVKDLLHSGQLVKLKRGRLGIASELNVRVGKISVTRSGVGYVEVEGEPDDILIPTPKLYTALDGDIVMVRLGGLVAERRSGAVIKIVERTKRNIVGVFHKSRHFAFVTPDNKKLHRDLYIPPGSALEAEEGEKVVAKLVTWDDPYRNPEAEIVERIGFPGQPGVDMLTIIKSYELPEEFSDLVMSEAEQAAARITEEEIALREDVTADCIYTIDPEDAKDHDDAVSVTRTENGYRLDVHIADVSYFVQEGTALDKEAVKRGNSVYLPGMVIPMLPEVLSSDVCSLKPNRKRLAYSVFIDFDVNGKMLRWRFADTVIRSRARLTYEEVQAYFDDGERSARLERVGDNLLVARELARVLTRRRFSEGSLDFDLPESKIILNKQGEVLELGHKVRLEAHRLVEEFMLAANRAVALEVFRKAQPFLYRVHDRPDLEKLEDFSALMARLGYSFAVSPGMRPVAFSRFLDKIKNVPEADFINELMLRSMKKAVYQRENIGHFGLAFDHYTHFTSPIRRYPDLLVHRLLRTLAVTKCYPLALARRVDSLIDRVSAHCSDTERAAETAEREAIKIKQMSFMARHVGDEFNGVISGVMPFGFFVRLDSMGVEGLVRMSTVDDDYYLYEEKRYRITGRRTGRVFQLGDKVKVGVLKVDKVAGEMDLFVVSKPEHKKAVKPRERLEIKKKTPGRKSKHRKT